MTYFKYLIPCSKCGKEFKRKTTGKYLCYSCKHNTYTKEFYKISKELKKISKCEICGETKNLHIHHKDKNKQNSSLDNLMVLCNQCHLSIHAHSLMMPKSVKYGLCGKRLVYRNTEIKPKQINKDKRWGHIFIKHNNYLLA